MSELPTIISSLAEGHVEGNLNIIESNLKLGHIKLNDLISDLGGYDES